MVKIRLRRTGKKKKPSYRVVIADVRSPRDGAFIEIIGHYDPLTEPPTIVIDEEKALKWLKQGAQPTETVASLLSKLGIMDKFKPAKTQGRRPAKRKASTTSGTRRRILARKEGTSNREGPLSKVKERGRRQTT